MNNDIKNAPIQSMKNRKTLEQHNQCGCYSCLKVFETTLIKNWTDQNQTALCPFCHTDSVVPIVDIEYLQKAKDYWFKS